jgi:hypothetical protein
METELTVTVYQPSAQAKRDQRIREHAPALLAALEAICAEAVQCDMDGFAMADGVLWAQITNARAAIAAAKGEG